MTVLAAVQTQLESLGTCEAGRLLGLAVCSAYWGGDYVIALRDLSTQLDSENLGLVVALLDYRNTAGWSDNEFWQLACLAKSMHDL